MDAHQAGDIDVEPGLFIDFPNRGVLDGFPDVVPAPGPELGFAASGGSP